MKRLFIVFIALLGVLGGVYAQSISRSEVDKFVKTRVVETSWERICGKNVYTKKHILASFGNYDGYDVLNLKWLCKYVCSIQQNDKVIFLDSEGEPHEYSAIRYSRAEKGAGVVKFVGSSAWGLNISVIGDIAAFGEKDMIAIRIYTTEGYVEFDMLPDETKMLKSLYKVYQEELSK